MKAKTPAPLAHLATVTDLTWHSEFRRFGDLRPWDKNPRAIDDANRLQLGRSISRFGYVEIIVINLDNLIIAGHKRYEQLGEQGTDPDDMIEVRVPNRLLTPDEVAEYNIRSNKNTGYWDDDLLVEYFEADDLRDWGFTEDELPDPFKELDEQEQFANEFEQHDNSTATYPIVPRLAESYDMFLVFSTNEIDRNYLEAFFEVRQEQSYKSPKLGKSFVIDGKRLITKLMRLQDQQFVDGLEDIDISDDLHEPS